MAVACLLDHPVTTVPSFHVVVGSLAVLALEKADELLKGFSFEASCDPAHLRVGQDDRPLQEPRAPIACLLLSDARLEQASQCRCELAEHREVAVHSQ